MEKKYFIFLFLLFLWALPVSAAHFSLDVSNSGVNATILVTADNPPSINGKELVFGDEIGVFTARGICAGLGIWTGGNLSVTVWGDDPEEIGVRGFTAGELYTIKLWDSSDDKEYVAQATYEIGDGIYEPNGITILSSLTANSHFLLQVSLTGVSAIVSIPSSNPPSINNVPISVEDEIGIFTPRGRCAGFGVWNGRNLEIIVWGDDPNVAGIRGFANGEMYSYRLWDISTGNEYPAAATYQVGDGSFVPQGITIINTLTFPVLDLLEIPLQAGWNHISSNLMPYNKSMEAVFADIIQNVLIIKNGKGEVNWPQFKVEQIKEWVITDGYQIKMSVADTLLIHGLTARPEEVSYELDGWKLISFLGPDGRSPELAFGSIIDSVVLAKDGLGKVFWPQYGIDQLGSMQIGQGYLIRVSEAVTFSYAETTSKVAPVSDAEVPHFLCVPYTDNNASILITDAICPSMAGASLTNGDEIGVFTEDGICAGCGTWEGKNLVITVWGNDAQTPEKDGIKSGETYRFKIWDSESCEEYNACASYASGSDQYTVNDLVILSALVGDIPVYVDEKVLPQQFILSQNYPNPFNPQTSISFYLPESCFVTLKVYNTLGEVVSTIVQDTISAGEHTMLFDGSGFASGQYIYLIKAGVYCDSKKFTLLK
ncbi:MAG: T9SS type A sorting domain-containing protein [Candidatus Latescibacteria bacterium]|nr:T9SS type A sorting domain-containing protein [Candidatus Latescibacterota bacterium]